MTDLKTMKLAEQAGFSPALAMCYEDLLLKFAALVHNAAIENAAYCAEDYLDDPFLSGHGYATNCFHLIMELKRDSL